MPFINNILKWVNFKRMHQIDIFKKYPVDAQKETLFDLITQAKPTVWGKEHHFKSIKTITDFQKQIQLNSYEDLKPYIERIRNGEKDVLWPGMIKWFAKSSGTTSDKSKFIPVSKEALKDNHFRGARDVLAIYTHNFPDNEIFSGKGLTLGGSHQINKISNQSLFGDLSAILIENSPFWTNFIKTPRKEIALMDEWEEKLDIITKTTIKENVTNIAGVPSWNLVLIKHILDYTGKNNLNEVWPNLELFIHGGVSFEPYRKQFESLIPSPRMNYMETYNASEGFFAIQESIHSSDLLLMLDVGVFYEFIPIEELDSDNPTVLTIEGVETGRNYAMIISTNSGLWRYKIGDTVRFTSTYPHKIKISGRTKHFINAFGEELIIDNAETALKKACDKTNASVREYTVAPVYMDKNNKGAHEWFIEFENAPANEDYFLTILDNALKSNNSDYEAKRYKDITLERPKLTIMRNGSFYKWFEKHNKLGGQNKMPRLYNNRKYAEELIQITNQLKKN
jgi:hypothetical protein